MFVDASVIVAILNEETGWEELADRLTGAMRISPVAYYEASIAIARAAALIRGVRTTADDVADACRLIDNFLAEFGIEEMPISAALGRAAVDAAAHFGKAVGHAADLNMGDCFAYACAKSLGMPLLYKGNDFAKTDLA